MNKKRSTAMLHYAAPPVIGGVEGVIQAHCEVFKQHGCPVAVIAGRGEAQALPAGTDFYQIPQLDTQHPRVLAQSADLEQGQMPADFEAFAQEIAAALRPILERYDNLIVHNVFTKHFNLPLTAALFHLLEEGVIRNGIAWCHDFTWISPHSRARVHPGYPWDLLRRFDPRLQYVTVSQERQRDLAALLAQPEERVQVIYNGVNPQILLGLSPEGTALIQKLNLLPAELILLMPVRVTQAKNIEYALDVLKALKAKGVRAKLVHTGPPDPHSDQSMTYFESLQARRQALGLADAMHFVFEAGPHPGQPYQIDLEVVGDLYRVSDILLMPSHREGFGMPVLEAGLAGVTAFCSSQVPAAREIGSPDVHIFKLETPPDTLAERMIHWMETSPQYRFRQRVRRQYTWEAIFEHDLLPLLGGAA